jgi:thymidine kinase
MAGSSPVFEGDQIAIDGDAEITYESLCGACFIREQEAAGVRLVGT